MKLATLKDGSRDGQLLVVSRDLKTACIADGIAPTLQHALDDWNFIQPQLEELFNKLNAGRATYSFDFEAKNCMRLCPGHSSGLTVLLMSIMWNWYAKPGMPRCRTVSGMIP